MWEYVIISFVCDMLDVVDNFNCVVSVVDESVLDGVFDVFKNFIEGVVMIEWVLLFKMEGYGIKKVDLVLGEVFDLNIYQVVVQILFDQFNGMIVLVMQIGYMIGKWILCVVMVVVLVGVLVGGGEILFVGGSVDVKVQFLCCFKNLLDLLRSVC